MISNPEISSTRITRNFDLSIVLPFYKKCYEFKRTLQKNHFYFQRNGIEVIIVMDDPAQEQLLLELVKSFPLINWKILINRNSHAWRNPSKAINVGIRHAANKYILVMGPDSEFYTDVIFNLRYMAEFYPDSFFTGQVYFCEEDTVLDHQSIQHMLLPYGSILASKQSLLAVRGYDEQLINWGGDDDNIRARLSLSGLQHIAVSQAILVHREKDNHSGHTSRAKKSRLIPVPEKKKIFYPEEIITNKISWGKDFSEIIYDYRENIFSSEMLKRFLHERSLTFDVPDESAFTKKFRSVILMPVFNEQKHVPEVLLHLDKYCDGIILLDDGSNDQTYEVAASQKLILKIKKKRQNTFDDLGNRNLLLDIASFFRADWFLFMDADERFDSRWPLRTPALALEKFDTGCFYLVHLWDTKKTYRSDIPESGPTEKSGIIHRWRIFRNKGRMNIVNDNKLHFPTIPYVSKKVILPVLILHYGMMDKEVRVKKYSKYIIEDPEKAKYSYFLSEKISLEKVSEITQADIRIR